MTNFSGENLNIGACAGGPQGERRDSASNKYQAYPEYKDSGLEWFGDIPADWDVWKWKHTLASPMTYGANEAALDDDVNNPRYIRITDMNSDGTLRDDTFKSLSFDAARNYLLKDGDILVARTGATVGKSFLYKEKFGSACFAGYLIRARINKKIVEPEFVSWYLQSDQYWKYISSSQIQATLQNVSAEKYGDMEIAIPSRKQDRLSITNFLDHETAKIDTLIEKQQQLIQLLKEKRQAVISRAVTKGLNPDAPMKDSGVEWLGEVPEHWMVYRLKQLVTEPLMYGANEAALDTDTECPRFIRITDVLPDGTLKNDTFRSLSESLAKPYLLKNGDILLARTGGTVGKSFMYSESWGRCCFAGYLIKASLNKAIIIPDWFYQYTNTQYYWEWIASSQIQATLPNVSADKYNNFVLVVPSIDEQCTILDKLKITVDAFNDLESKAQTAIELMQERRTALISAAVTGKIDVRNWQGK